MTVQYLRLIRHDAQTLEILSRAAAASTPPADVSDWKCTLTFYIACIYVKALAATRKVQFEEHFGLRQWLNTTADVTAIARPYRKLEERSRDARYEGRLFTSGELREAHRWFSEVRDKIVGLLKASGIQDVPSVDPAPWLL